MLLQNIANFLVAIGPWGLLALAFMDSCGIPIANTLDAYLIFLAIKQPDQAYGYAAIAVAGSAVGNAVLFVIARHGGRRYLQRAESGRAQRFRRWFERFGLITVFVPALMPIPMPLKIFVISAGALRRPFMPFLAVVILARLGRYFGETWLGIKLGQESAAYLRHHVWQFVAASLALFAVLCLLVLASEWWRKRRQSTG